MPPNTVNTDEQNLTSATLDSNNILTIDIERGDSVQVDLTSLLDDTDDQTLSVNGDTLFIEDGNYVLITDLFIDADADITNEIQTLSMSNDTIFLSSGGICCTAS